MVLLPMPASKDAKMLSLQLAYVKRLKTTAQPCKCAHERSNNTPWNWLPKNT